MDSGDPVAGVGGQGRNIVQLLALFLLLLSFFILLNSLSSVEARRARAVLDSLGETFSRSVVPTAEGPYVEVGNRVALQRFQDAVREALRAVVPPAALAPNGSGAVIEASVAADDLFQPDGSALRADRDSLLRGIATALVNHPADLRFEVELVLAGRQGDEGIDRARAGSFARALVERGAPPDAVAIGLGGGAPGSARLRFAFRSSSDGLLDFAPTAMPQENAR